MRGFKKTLIIIFINTSIIMPTFAKPVLKIEHWTTSNGAEVLFVANHELPMLDVKVIFNAGSSRDGDRFGLATATNSMLKEGSLQFTAGEIATKFDEVGAVYNDSVDLDKATLSLRTLTEPKIMAAALETFSSVLTEPSFSAEEWRRVQQQALSAIKEQEQYPDAIASKTFFHALYGDLPYGHPALGTTETVAKINPDDLRNFYRQYYVASNALIVLVGDLSLDQAKKISNSIVSKLPGGQAAISLPAALGSCSSCSKSKNSVHIEFPSEQTHIFVGSIGIARSDPDFFQLLVGNYIFGRSPLASILFAEIRDKRGLAYSIGSSFMNLQTPGPFLIVMQTQNARVGEAIPVVEETLQNFLTNGPTEDQLQQAKDGLIGNFPLGLDSNSRIAANLAFIGFYNLPLNYFDTYRQNVAAVTAEQIKTAWRRHINMENLTIVTVGKKK